MQHEIIFQILFWKFHLVLTCQGRRRGPVSACQGRGRAAASACFCPRLFWNTPQILKKLLFLLLNYLNVLR